MASENFWKDNSTQDPQFEGQALHELLDQKPNEKPAIGLLLRQYYRSIALNITFLFLTLLLYLVKPIPDLLLPIGIISSCFIYILYHVLIATRNINQTIDMSLDLKSTLKKTLEINQHIIDGFCRLNSWILTSSFIGGFLLGLLLSDWTLLKMIDKPIVIVIGAGLTTGFYFLTKSSGFASIQQSLNPSYHRAKNRLEEQLKALEDR